MASVSVSHAILFIASIVVAASVAGVLTTEVGRLSAAIDDRGVDVSQDISSDIEVISDAGSSDCCYDGTNITLLAKNTGTDKLPTDTDQVDVLVDAQYDPDVFVTVVDGSEWLPNNVARITITEPGLASGDHRVKLIVRGDEEVFEFRV